ncbi:MAG TPA: tripartite tricarboxylate transporter permease [Methanocella sp.]|uniref:tripartite tricarboxylate transporter permease n=1 Tax=Methanocella sp. TaxID=2052833 RepID=UPI002C590EFD|nr:tripartite tricarboxylate transporter permease [Methanocella sp.]HTY91457.1 tripartite tricarboxylate transporter permease [Methanocella sp.]
MLELSLVLFCASVFGGIVVGAFAGLLPGIHVNNTSAILLGMTPALVASGLPALYVAVMIVASTISQSFLDIVPSIFLGAPDEATAMAVLPGHRMLQEGRGVEAVRLSAMGSGLAIGASLLLMAPISLFFKSLNGPIQGYMGIILIAISALVILSNRGKGPFAGALDRLKAIAWAAAIFLVCGLLGLAAFSAEGLLVPLVHIAAPEMLLPLLSGLFGAPTLLLSLNSSPAMPPQHKSTLSLPAGDVLRSALAGTAAGALVSWFPAVSTGVATTVTGMLSKKSEADDRKYIVSISGVNTANAVFSLVALYVIGHPRSGAVAAAQSAIGSIDFETFMLLAFAMCLAGALTYPVTILAGGVASGVFTRVNYRLLNATVLLFLAAMCLAMTGFLGLAVFAVAGMAGLAPHLVNVRKTCLMGVLLVPCIIYFI